MMTKQEDQMCLYSYCRHTFIHSFYFFDQLLFVILSYACIIYCQKEFSIWKPIVFLFYSTLPYHHHHHWQRLLSLDSLILFSHSSPSWLDSSHFLEEISRTPFSLVLDNNNNLLLFFLPLFLSSKKLNGTWESLSSFNRVRIAREKGFKATWGARSLFHFIPEKDSKILGGKNQGVVSKKWVRRVKRL